MEILVKLDRKIDNEWDKMFVCVIDYTNTFLSQENFLHNIYNNNIFIAINIQYDSYVFGKLGIAE